VNITKYLATISVALEGSIAQENESKRNSAEHNAMQYEYFI